MKKFGDYWDRHSDYYNPTDSSYINVGEPGWVIDFISWTFLDGWINHVKIVAAYAVACYNDPELVKARVERWRELPHTELSHCCGDNVTLLARGEDGDYWWFYYDCDVSDCSIARFRTEDPEARVIELLEAHASGMDHGDPVKALFKLDPKKIGGGVSW